MELLWRWAWVYACVAAISLAGLASESLACCANKCSGHGQCQTGTCTCLCHAQWGGADCSYRACPSGRQWSGDASGVDALHSTSAVCSGVGKCATGSGACECQEGFEGLACERMACPDNCNNHGQCVSLKDAAAARDDRSFFREVTYSSAWDASRIYGCQCDVGYSAYDCSVRDCPSGDDPLTTGQADEVQVLDCTCSATCSGSFYLSFRGEVTDAIGFDGTAAALEAALEALPTVHGVSVALTGGSALCDADGVSAAVTFTHNPGDVPSLRVHKNDLATSGATASVAVVHSGQTSGQGVSSVVGTKEDLECNGRGTCDTSTGLCTCYTNLASSDRAGAAGNSGDCGYASSVAACPGDTECSGHGTCSGAADYVCSCYGGYTGADCNTRECPVGRAWFSEPGTSLPGYISITNGASSGTTTADLRTYVNRGDTVVVDGNVATVSTATGDTFDATTLPLSESYAGATTVFAEAAARPELAHPRVECSNRGHCSSVYGTCTCMSGFTGSACQKTACPSDCSGTGVCMSNAQRAAATESSGDATAYSYGADASVADTWDAHQIFGCRCDAALAQGGMYDAFGHDCSQLACPTGDDPSTAGVHEVQSITCSATGGSFTASFRQLTTAAVAFDATAAEVQAALELLDSVVAVTVAFDTGVAACSSGGVVASVTFTANLGDVPAMTTTTSLTGGSATAVVAEPTKGTMENVECSNHGLCDRSTGACSCFSGYVSSDGAGADGTRSDCGARDALFVAS